MPQATTKGSSGLRKLADVIKENHRKVQEGLCTTLDAAIAAGEALNEAKRKHGLHGKWRPWVKQSTGLSLRTAQQYMQLAAHREQLMEAKAQGNALFSIAQAVQLIAGKTEPNKPQQKESTVDKDDDGLDKIETVSRRGSRSNHDDDEHEVGAPQCNGDAQVSDNGAEKHDVDDDNHYEVRREVGLFQRLTQEKPDKSDRARREFDDVYDSQETKMQQEIAEWADSITESVAEKLRQDNAVGTVRTSELKKAVLHRLGQSIARLGDAE